MNGEPLTGVSETALGAAMLRAEESARPDRLFDDALAAAFVAAAPEIFADGPEPGDPDVEQLRRSFTDQLALRTRFYDDYVLDGNDARPRCTRVAIGADLAQDWDDGLLDAGFDSNAVTAWTAEGLLAYLSDEQAETLLVRVSKRSSPRSRFAVEAARLTDDATLVEASTLSSLSSITAMWHGGLRDDPAHWLEEHDWTVERHDRVELAQRYRRPIADASTGGFLVAHRIEPARGS